MNYDNITDKTNKIIDNLNFLDKNISKIKKKIGTLNKIYNDLEKNSILIIDKNNYLVFQIHILKNEYIYYKNIYTIILNKYSNEVSELSEYIIMILLSLHKLEIGNYNQDNIFNKIIHVKKIKNITYGKLNETINSTINNLKLLDEYNKLFDTFVTKTISKNTRHNIHNNTFESKIKNKKEMILLEYNKYYENFNKIIEYFKECSESVILQIETSKVLSFFLENKSI